MTGPRMAIALAASLAIGCPGKTKDNTVKTGSGTGLTNLIKKTVLSWGFSPTGDQSEVFLVTTDETGAAVSHPVGTFPGTCEKLTPTKEMTAIIAAKCTAQAGGVELHAVKQTNEIIVMRMAAGSTDPMAREEVKRITIDLGAAIEAAP
jgi:hypothetical protein